MAVDTSNTTLIIVGASLGGALLLVIVVGAVLVCKYRKEALQWKAKAEAQPAAREGVPSVVSDNLRVSYCFRSLFHFLVFYFLPKRACSLNHKLKLLSTGCSRTRNIKIYTNVSTNIGTTNPCNSGQMSRTSMSRL